MGYKLQRVCEEDKDLLFEWANDKECRKNSFHSEAISYEEHCKWFSKQLVNQKCCMYLCYCENIPIGQVRINCEGEAGCISYFIASEYRGRGHAYNMLLLMECEMKGKIKQLTACVKYDNIASQMVFRKGNYIGIREKDYIKYSKNLD